MYLHVLLDAQRQMSGCVGKVCISVFLYFFLFVYKVEVTWLEVESSQLDGFSSSVLQNWSLLDETWNIFKVTRSLVDLLFFFLFYLKWVWMKVYFLFSSGWGWPLLLLAAVITGSHSLMNFHQFTGNYWLVLGCSFGCEAFVGDTQMKTRTIWEMSSHVRGCFSFSLFCACWYTIIRTSWRNKQKKQTCKQKYKQPTLKYILYLVRILHWRWFNLLPFIFSFFSSEGR